MKTNRILQDLYSSYQKKRGSTLYLYAVFILLDKLLNMFLNVDLTFGNTWRTAYFCSMNKGKSIEQLSKEMVQVKIKWDETNIIIKQNNGFLSNCPSYCEMNHTAASFIERL